MCASDIIVYIPDGAVQGPVFILSSRDGNGRLVAAENDRYEGGVDARLLLAYDVLEEPSAGSSNYAPLTSRLVLTACLHAHSPLIKFRR